MSKPEDIQQESRDEYNKLVERTAKLQAPATPLVLQKIDYDFKKIVDWDVYNLYR